jgi:carnitine O-acetyltransferase
VQSSQDLSTLTFGNEDRLPRVPLPELSDTGQRFLRWCGPLLTADQLAETERAVAEFLAPGSPAHRWHAELAGYDGSPGVYSWLDEFWRYRYLSRRDRIALNANFFFLFQDPPEPVGQVERAAGLVAAAVDYKLLIDQQLVPPEVPRGRPLSMEQLKYLFCGTRIPGPVLDSSRTPYTPSWPGPATQRHIVVFHRGNAFRLEVFGPAGVPHTLDELADGIRAVLAAGAEPARPGTSVGQLTTKARAEWAASRQALLALDPANAAAFEDVETALFCLALEDIRPADATAACDQLLHGDSANRWFDKALTLIVFADGSAGLNGEHCNLDGTTMVAFIDGVCGASPAEHSERSGARPQGRPGLAPVRFVTDDALRADIAEAGAAFTAYARACASTTLRVRGLTSERAKQLGCSPDALAQLCFQVAHQRAKGMVGATYESIATRQYRHGRTEAMRVITPEILAMVAALDDPAADRAARAAAVRAAARAHAERSQQCQAGQAPEQHLWELQLIGRRSGGDGVDEPALYRSPGWLIMRDDYLSTSAVPSPNVRFFGFGSTSPRCIGVGYGLMADRFDIYLSTPVAVREQMEVFAERLQEAVLELCDLLAEG